MDKEIFAAFRIALVVAIVVGFGLYQFNLKYKMETNITNMAITDAHYRVPSGWIWLRLNRTGFDSLEYHQVSACSLYIVYPAQDSVLGDSLFMCDVPESSYSVIGRRNNYRPR